MGDPVNPSYPGVGVAQIVAGTTLVASVGAIVGAEIFAARLAATVVDSNKVAHIFNQSRYGLDGVVRQFGSPGKAFRAMQGATEKAVRSFGTKGDFEITVKVGTSSVTVRGRVVDGAAKFGTAFIK
jgi:hypothetical protein